MMTDREIDNAIRGASSLESSVREMAEELRETRGNLADIQGDARAVVDAFDEVDGEDMTAEEALNKMRQAIKGLRRCLP